METWHAASLQTGRQANEKESPHGRDAACRVSASKRGAGGQALGKLDLFEAL